MTHGSQPDEERGGSAAAALRAARLAADLTQEQLAARIGCSISQLSQMEAGLRRITPERAALIDEALDLTDATVSAAVKWEAVPADLRRLLLSSKRQNVKTSKRQNRLGRGGDSDDSGPYLDELGARHMQLDALREALSGENPLDALRRLVERAATNVEAPLALSRRVPLINSVAAGLPIEFTDLGYPAAVADEYIACPDVDDPDAFAARVIGDSMAPEYREGEIVVFSPALPTPSGTDCFVRLARDDETTFKRVYFEEDGALIRLQPLNEAYPARTVDREEVAGLFAAAYVMRRVVPRSG